MNQKSAEKGERIDNNGTWTSSSRNPLAEAMRLEVWVKRNLDLEVSCWGDKLKRTTLKKLNATGESWKWESNNDERTFTYTHTHV